MPGVMSEQYGNIRIPKWVVGLTAYWRWRDESPHLDEMRIHFIDGDVWVDLSMEEMFTHNRIKTALGITLGGLVEGEDRGLYATEGMALSNRAAGLATEPDAMFISNDSLKARRVKFVAGKRRGAKATRVVGAPDVVIEVVSPNSEEKDTAWLMSAYHAAGIPEYWLIDARDDNDLQFTIYKWGDKGYTPAPNAGGWVKSPVLKKSFHLTRKVMPNGYPQFRLEVR